MDNEPIPSPHQLTKKPLVEAIFELRWALRSVAPGLPPQDPGFRIALGRYYDRVRAEYPAVQDLPTAQVPEDMTAYAVRHQFRAGKDAWPVTQLGPGILTVNDTAGYNWDTFKPRLMSAIDAIFSAYPSDITPFQPVGVQLRYIDAIPYNPNEKDPVRFLSEQLHTSVCVEPKIFDNPEAPDAAVGVNLNLTFPLKTPAGVGILGFANGAREGTPAIILEIIIRSDGTDVPKNREEFAAWLQDAHAVVDKWFFTLCRGELLTTFEGGNDKPDA